MLAYRFLRLCKTLRSAFLENDRSHTIYMYLFKPLDSRKNVYIYISLALHCTTPTPSIFYVGCEYFAVCFGSFVDRQSLPYLHRIRAVGALPESAGANDLFSKKIKKTLFFYR